MLEDTEHQKCIHADISCTKSMPLCCGTCEEQYCCDDSKLELNQNTCASCMGFSKSLLAKQKHSEKFAPQRCDAEKGEFCCGTCTKRYCCSNNSDRLNQMQCVITSHLASVLIILVLIVFLCAFCYVKLNKNIKRY